MLAANFGQEIHQQLKEDTHIQGPVTSSLRRGLRPIKRLILPRSPAIDSELATLGTLPRRSSTRPGWLSAGSPGSGVLHLGLGAFHMSVHDAHVHVHPCKSSHPSPRFGHAIGPNGDLPQHVWCGGNGLESRSPQCPRPREQIIHRHESCQV
ncbi:hypothetical protein G7046_g3635 [Stylonectria norvegica]|nr:hypothetical protein G7046_g3635 [Stylonectria norvegica]